MLAKVDLSIRGKIRVIELKQSASVHFLSLLLQLPIAVEQDRPLTSMPDLLSLSINLELSSYDLSYLDLAMRKGCPLATLDQKLREAAGMMGVPILYP